MEQERVYETSSNIGCLDDIGKYSNFKYWSLANLGISVAVSNRIADFYKLDYSYFNETKVFIENDVRIVYQLSDHDNQK